MGILMKGDDYMGMKIRIYSGYEGEVESAVNKFTSRDDVEVVGITVMPVAFEGYEMEAFATITYREVKVIRNDD